MCNLFPIGTDAEMWSLYSGAKSNLRDRILVKGFPGGASGKKKKNIPLPVQEMQETWVQSLSWEKPLEYEIAT